MTNPVPDPSLPALRDVLDRRPGILKQLAGVTDLASYLAAAHGDDEETLTEPVLADLLQSVLGFPTDDKRAKDRVRG